MCGKGAGQSIIRRDLVFFFFECNVTVSELTTLLINVQKAVLPACLSPEESSHVNTPDDSDEDDAGNGEEIIGLVPGHDDQGGNTRSRNNSYANLQRLRLSALAQTSGVDLSPSPLRPPSPGESEGLHIRTGHRNRK
ncbi:hypothetical protein GYMLUDRAFT_665621 [Collybiopsis luxurians FD-317 M1]|uniref:Uncharacterized protein n=1 Tax=Collybiopsis luxurians FD-317 M1 TaxID=944289 RepID=A0A0D0CML9_9AGAR|nr:hypothetical protein GYMLUDRAFT_665621 [Collybiopsis luxurians FD-317 M1]